MKKFLVFLIILCASPLQAQQEMTLDEAIRIGLQNNYTIQIARNAAQIAANNRGRGIAGLLPTLDISGNTQRSKSDEDFGSPFGLEDSEAKSWNAQIALNWTLFDGFRMFADNKRYKELAKLGDYQAREIIENMVVGISRAYLNLVQQEQLLDVAREARDISETRLAKEQVRRDIGGASSTDLLNAQVALNNDQSSYLEQQLQVTIARQDLNVFLGRDPVTPVVVSKEITIPALELTTEEVRERAVTHNSALLVARQNTMVAEQSVKAARASFFPRLSLQSTYGYTDRTVSNYAGVTAGDMTTTSADAGVGLYLSFNLFNGSRHKIEWQNARLDARNQELALRDVENQLAQLTRELSQTFEQRLAIVELEQQNIIAARQNLDLQQDRFRLGATTSLEFRDAQVSFIRAQTALIIARYQARISRLELEKLIGNLSIE